MQKFTVKTRHINSKQLMAEIKDFVDSIIVDFSIVWTSDSQRDAILDVLDEHLQDLAAEKKIERWNIVCDARNNKKSTNVKGETYLDIEYMQYNCYNISELNYTIIE